MADKILCPWCGAEMNVCSSRRKVQGEWRDYYDASMRCMKCGAQGPVARMSTREGAKEVAVSSALRRYTPTIKPMTLEELEKRIAEFDIRDGDTYYVEHKDSWGSWIAAMYIWYELFLHKDVKELYGKKWRCWERKPTDEERSAAEWET